MNTAERITKNMNGEWFMKEEWKDVRDYQGLYQVSNLNRVKRLYKNGHEIILKQYKNNSGYNQVTLYKKGCKPKNCTVHRLVFESFYRRLLPNEDCHHINTITTDNRAVNLVARDSSEHIREHNMKRIDQITQKFLHANKDKPKSEQWRKKMSSTMKKVWEKRKNENRI